MALFDLPKNRSSKAKDSKIIQKANSKKTTVKTIKSGDSVLGRINEIKAMVNANLGKYKDDYIVINDKEVLHDYITECIGNSYISIDTETDGLDPLQNILAGICPYTYGQKGAYIPLNHISYITGTKASNQLDMDFVMSEFKRLLEKKPSIDMFNAKFDMRFLRANGLENIYCTWDGYLASQLMNENEPTHGLKALHKKYVLNGQGDAFSFDDLFKGIPFTMIPYNVGYLYAAHDPVITTELCDYQRQYMRKDAEREDLRNLWWVMTNIEMPCVSVVADMEDTGVEFDFNKQAELSVQYNQYLDDALEEFYQTLEPYENEIAEYMQSATKLSNPVNVNSPTQIAIILYDIVKLPVVDKKKPRGTGEDILVKMNHPIADAVLKYRELSKLVDTYIDKLPECVADDGRIHCNFNQYGAKTGRFSSSNPNLQNIPSHNKDIRKMFVATNEEKLVTTDTHQFEVDRWCEVECADEWKYADKLIVGDELLLDGGSCVNVVSVDVQQNKVFIELR